MPDLPGRSTVHEVLADVALRAPGAGAPRAALSVLDQLAWRGDVAAALALARVTGIELGLDVSTLTPERCSSLAALAEVAGTAGAPVLPCLLAAGFLPWQFVAGLEQWKAVALQHTAYAQDSWPSFQELVARGGMARDFALRGYAMAELVAFTGLGDVLGTGTDSLFLMSLVRVAMGARVVDGGGADNSFRFGEDLLLMTGPEGLTFQMGHEFTHHLSDWGFPGLAGDQARDVAADGRALASVLPDVLPAVLTASQGESGYQFVSASSGLRLGCSRDQHERGGLLHVSMSGERGSLEPLEAAVLAWLAAELLGVPAAGSGRDADPDQRSVAVAISPDGVVHVGVPTAGVAPDEVRQRAARPDELIERAIERSGSWMAGVSAAGMFCADERDLRYLLGAESRPALVAVDPSAAGADLESLRLTLAGEGLADRRPDQLREFLRSAVRCGHPDAVAALVAAGAGPGYSFDIGADAAESDGSGIIAGLGTSLAVIWAGQALAYQGPSPGALVAVVAELVRGGFDVGDVVLDGGETLLTDAAARDLHLTTALLEAGVRPDGRNARGANGLASARSPEVAQVLLSAGADPNAADELGQTAMHHAAGKGDIALVRTLLFHGAVVDARTHSGEEPVMFAASPDMVAALCDAGADVDASTMSGATALMLAAQQGSEAVLRSLLARGANVHAATGKGESALHHAAQAPPGMAPGIIDALIAAGADVDEETDDGETALGLAAVVAGEEAVEALIAAGADVNATTVHGTTPLMCASSLDMERAREFTYPERMMGCMRRLINAGAVVDTADDEGQTALHYAARAFDSQITGLLLEVGADPNVRDLDGRTPLDLARAQGHKAMIDDLLAHGAVGRPESGDDD